MIPMERVGVMPDGNYKLMIKNIEKKPGGSGYDYLSLELVVFDNGKPTENIVWNNVSLSPKSRFMLSNFLDAIQAPTSGQLHYRSFKGKTCWATLGHDTWKGKLKNVVETFLTPEAAGHPEDKLKDGEFSTDYEEEPAAQAPKNREFVWDDSNVTDEDGDEPELDELSEDEDVVF